MPDPKEIIGEAGVKALADAGFTITPPKAPDPVRLVTMEESMGRYIQWSVRPPRKVDHAEAVVRWGAMWHTGHETNNAADNWLVRTVNRRIIEELPDEGRFWVCTGSRYSAYRHDLLRIFCGEGNP